MKRGKSEDNAGGKSGPDSAGVSKPKLRQRVTRQQVYAKSGKGEMKEDYGVVGNGQPKVELQGQGPQAVEVVERVKKQTHPGRRVEEVGEEEVGLAVEQSFLDPPLVPVILPAVKAVAGNSRSQIGGGGPGHQNTQ